MRPTILRSLGLLASVFASLAFAFAADARQPGDPYADRVGTFSLRNPHNPDLADPGAALGTPDFNEASISGFFTLGVGGSITLEFVDNVAVNGPGPDLQILGDPANDELWKVEVSPDGATYKSLGMVGEVVGN